jgi:hypothetical protein
LQSNTYIAQQQQQQQQQQRQQQQQQPTTHLPPFTQVKKMKGQYPKSYHCRRRRKIILI